MVKEKIKSNKYISAVKKYYRIILIFLGLFSVLYWNWQIFESIDNKILTTLLYILIIIFSILNKKLNYEKKIALLFSIFLVITTIIFLKIAIQEGSIIILSLVILFGVATYNHFVGDVFKINKILYLNVFILILTIATLDATNPILKPRVDISEVGQIYHGYIINGEEYAIRDYTIEITPPIIFAKSCETIRLGNKIRGANYKQDIYGTQVKTHPNGEIDFCLNKGSNFKSVIVLSITSDRKLNYIVGSYNLSRFYWISENDKTIRQHPIAIYNNENFPIFFQGNLTFFITNITEFDNNENMLSELLNNSKKMKCKLEQFSLVRNITTDKNIVVTEFESKGQSKKERDSISLNFPSYFFTIDTSSFKILRILYYPYNCY